MKIEDHIKRLETVKGYCCAKHDTESLEYAIGVLKRLESVTDKATNISVNIDVNNKKYDVLTVDSFKGLIAEVKG